VIAPAVVVPEGPPGSGKSTFCASVCDLPGITPEEVLLCTTKPGEAESWAYKRHGLVAERYFDSKWRPTLDQYEATDFVRLLRRMYELYEDDRYGAIIVDPGTDVPVLAEHYIVQSYNVGGIGELQASGQSQAAYRTLAEKTEEFVKTIAVLATEEVVRPKWVLLPFHIQPPKAGQYVKDPSDPSGRSKVYIESADEQALDLEFGGRRLPQIEGGYRRRLNGDVGIVVYCEFEETPSSLTKIDGKMVRVPAQTRYLIQPAPSKEAHAKVRGSPVLRERLPNSMVALVAAMEAAQNGAT